jgi:hypothetical protein
MTGSGCFPLSCFTFLERLVNLHLSFSKKKRKIHSLFPVEYSMNDSKQFLGLSSCLLIRLLAQLLSAAPTPSFLSTTKPNTLLNEHDIFRNSNHYTTYRQKEKRLLKLSFLFTVQVNVELQSVIVIVDGPSPVFLTNILLLPL